MLQVIQYQKSGVLYVDDVPVPSLCRGGVLVRNYASLISAGTERSTVRTAQAGMVGKARSRPDLVRQVKENVRREGLVATYKKVRTRLDTYKALGYSSAGVVIESACDAFQVGDRVACGGYAHHAEVISVPQHLCARMSDGVVFEEAAFTTLGAIALQGMRQAEVRVGECVAVIGLGLVGQLTVQLLKAAGCRVIGLDVSERAMALARTSGAEAAVKSSLEAIEPVRAFSRGRGVDAVILTAATTSNEPMELAGEIARDRGRLVIVGAVKADLPRSSFYEKELEVRMSRSYGPGRYDPNYEGGGQDYPIGYVRWTEQRNMEAFLDLMAQGKVDVKPLITHRFPIAEATKAYDLITGKTKEPYMAVVLQYPADENEIDLHRTIRLPQSAIHNPQSAIRIGFIGAGNFAQAHLLPHLKDRKTVVLEGVVTSTGLSAKSAAQKFDFRFAATDPKAVLDNEAVQAVFIATRHDSHARYVIEALRKGKAVYVEKPLAVSLDELEDIREVMREDPSRFLMVGYNRRFSKPVRTIQEFLRERPGPLILHYRVNAGPLSPGHWQGNPAQGGRILGEGCHFVDVMQFLTGARPVDVSSAWLSAERSDVVNRDNVSVTIRFDDGSVGTLLYAAVGDPSFSKERLEIFGGGAVAVMEDFRRVHLVRDRKRKVLKFNGDKGHGAEMAAVVDAMREGKASPISFESLHDTTWVTLEARGALERRQGQCQ